MDLHGIWILLWIIYYGLWIYNYVQGNIVEASSQVRRRRKVSAGGHKCACLGLV